MRSLTRSSILVCALAAILKVTSDAATYGDITFFVVSDLHYGYAGMQAANQATIDSMNALPGQSYPAEIGGTVDAPRGVLAIGDLTDNGNDPNSWSQFVADWGLNGSARLEYPVYEGYGNHDWNTIVRNGIKSRNPQRAGVTNISTNGYHYSWDWDQIHFVMCNLFAGDLPDADGSPDSSLSFLKSDLESKVGSSGRPVVVLQHYGWDISVRGSNIWWDDAQKAAMYDVVKDYNVIAFFHGHCHCVESDTFHSFTTFADGSVRQWNGGTGNFFAVHINGDQMTVVNRDTSGWNQSWTKTINPGPGTVVVRRALARGSALGLRLSGIITDFRGRRIQPSLHTARMGLVGKDNYAGVFFVKNRDGTSIMVR
jgi:cytolysin (calcineurin-like family phosphatase)